MKKYTVVHTSTDTFYRGILYWFVKTRTPCDGNCGHLKGSTGAVSSRKAAASKHSAASKENDAVLSDL